MSDLFGEGSEITFEFGFGWKLGFGEKLGLGLGEELERREGEGLCSIFVVNLGL